ncbi:response regulator [Oscillatoria sp. CS-180]|uniref:response regulator n=1 Tax=Oscillatoria sp. CS-180 TaxID=3021720 RepID=UPI0023314C96|nr:response regulator [Oscillatoria sp. CS-180]MDB9526383.1 response regulator [Oscillatoria sp. CS-180]
MRILLVEDDESVAKTLEKSLISEHYAVDVANDGQAGWQLVSSFDYDLILLDVMLPKLDGIQLCRRLRENSYHMPILLVTALDSSTQKIEGLDAGADDCITKPFEIEELLARIRVLLRRTETPLLSMLRWGELKLDPNSQDVTYGDLPIKLTPKEFRLLELFLRKPSQVFSRGAILDSLWSCSETPGEDTVTAHIRGLRRKLVAVGVPGDLIKTVYGVGYRLKPIEASSPRSRHQSTSSTQAQLETQLTSIQQKQTQAALITLWKSVKSQHLERLAVLKRTIQALRDRRFTRGLREEAYQAAHSLTGALGIFGLKSGSDLARSIEHILHGKEALSSQSQQQLVESVEALETELNQALSHLNRSSSRGSSPLVVLIDKDLGLAQQIATTLRSHGFSLQISADEMALEQLLLSSETSSSADHTSDTAASTKDLPDVILLNFSLTDSTTASLKRLARIINQTPPLLLVVCSADGDLSHRVKAARLGSHSFLHAPTVDSVIRSVLEIKSRLHPASHRVLAVDDDSQVLQGLQTLLEPRGFELVTLNRPHDFWSTLQTASPDLLLLDIEMPNFNGFELCKAVRQAPFWNQLPIIFLTAHDDANTRAAAFRAGANDLVEKSHTDSTLLNCLFEQIKQSQLHQAMTAIAPSPHS